MVIRLYYIMVYVFLLAYDDSYNSHSIVKQFHHYQL